ncbi:hypothetical protein SBP02_11925 [Pseudomonas benzenivorans]|uniref:Uncharacterized protein n=1 Tax=Pseudomonas benzenivorans TaxID=556533 RepID=A0ABZ0PQQ5_9PSED|nr:hypothetical protein [Pseudomonas benzenivorans]WPC03493.1 hypothetical protein SBP02_11925 [Pseudomonas benzenivorans]
MTRALNSDEAKFLLFTIEHRHNSKKKKKYFADYGEINIRAYFDFIKEFGYHNTHDKQTFAEFRDVLADIYLQNPERQEYAVYLRSKLEDDLNI